MPLRTYVPAPPLTPFVDCFWFAHGLDHNHAWERVLPIGAMQIVMNLRNDATAIRDHSQPESATILSGAVLNGIYTRPLELHTDSRAATVGVSFAPGGAAPFFDRPASELHNQTVSLETLWGTTGRQLRPRLLAASTPLAKFRVLDAALRTHLAASSASSFVNEAIEVVRAHAGTMSVRALVEQTGYSHRHVADRFQARVGLSPKRFSRVVRFQSMLSRVRERTTVDWPRVALACGYYDQSHLIRDFQAFANMTPTAYRNRAPAEQNHVPLTN
jgi:AraC-like DNA-binding protein